MEDQKDTAGGEQTKVRWVDLLDEGGSLEATKKSEIDTKEATNQAKAAIADKNRLSQEVPNVAEELPERPGLKFGILFEEENLHPLNSIREVTALHKHFRPVRASFGLISTQEITLVRGEQRYSVLNMPNANFSGLKIQKLLSILPGENKWYGANKKYIDDKGQIDTQAVIYDYTRNMPEKTWYTKGITNRTCELSTYDSHTYYIHNMLTTWYYTVLYESSNPQDRGSFKDTDGTLKLWFKANVPFYSDSHCLVYYDDKRTKEEQIVFGQTYSVAQLKAKVSLVPRAYVVHNDADYYHAFKYVVKYAKLESQEESMFLAGHLYPRAPWTADMNFDIGFTHDITTIGVDIEGHIAQYEYPPEWSVDNTYQVLTADQIMSWILKYVHINRLYADFTQAFEVLVRSAYWPIPESLEGCVWPQTVKMVIHLPQFSPVRAFFPLMLEGEPFEEEKTNKQLFVATHTLGQRFLYGAIENYLLSYAMGSYLFDFSYGRFEWWTQLSNSAILSTMDNSYSLYEALFRDQYGYELTTAMNRYCFVSLTLSGLTDSLIRQIEPPEKTGFTPNIAPDFERKINLRTQRPAVFTVDAAERLLQKQAIPYGDAGQLLAVLMSEHKPSAIMDLLDEQTKKAVGREDFSYVYKHRQEIFKNYMDNLAKKHNTCKVCYYFPSWVSFGIFDGTIANPYTHDINLAPTLTFKGGYTSTGTVTLGTTEALILAQALRYFSYEITCTQTITIETENNGQQCIDVYTFRPWAPVHTRIIEPSSLLYTSQYEYVTVKDMVVRQEKYRDRMTSSLADLLKQGFQLQKHTATFKYSGFLKTREYNYPGLMVDSKINPRRTLVMFNQSATRFTEVKDLVGKMRQADQNFQMPQAVSLSDPHLPVDKKK